MIKSSEKETIVIAHFSIGFLKIVHIALSTVLLIQDSNLNFCLFHRHRTFNFYCYSNIPHKGSFF